MHVLKGYLNILENPDSTKQTILYTPIVPEYFQLYVLLVVSGKINMLLIAKYPIPSNTILKNGKTSTTRLTIKLDRSFIYVNIYLGNIFKQPKTKSCTA